MRKRKGMKEDVEMKIIDTELLDKVSEQAKASPRLRMNFNLRPFVIVK